MFPGVVLLAVASGCLQAPRGNSMSMCVSEDEYVYVIGSSVDEGQDVPNVVGLATHGTHV